MASAITGKPQLNRMINRRLILDRIRRLGVVSRADLAKQTAIRPPTVSAVVRELIDDGLVEEVGAGETSGGRAPRLVSLRRSQPLALGFELSETSIHAGLCDLTGELTCQTKITIAPPTPEEAVDQLHEVGARLLREAGLAWKDLVGVGVAVPGHLNLAEGSIRWSKPFGWRDIPFKALCEQRWRTPTDVVNDSLAGGMAGHLFETQQSVDNLVFLYLRFEEVLLDVIGLGAGIIVNGEPYHGEFGAAGEITMPIKHPMAAAAESGTPFKSIDEFVAAFTEGNEAAQRSMDRLATDLSLLVLHVVNLLEPGVLMLGSDVPTLRDALIGPLDAILQKHRLEYEMGQTRLLSSQLGDFGVVRGAVVPTLQRLFRIPALS